MRTKVLASIDTPLNPTGLIKAEHALRRLGVCVQIQSNLFELNTSLAPSQIHSALRTVLDSADRIYVGYVAVPCAS